MPLTYAKYQKLQALLKDPKKDFSDEARERAQAAIEQYQNDYSKRASGAQPFDQLEGNPLAMPREGESPIVSVDSPKKGRPTASAPQPATSPDEARVQQVISQLDPSMSLPSQALALQPATTHPGGDEAAKQEWIRGDLNNPNGLVVAYDLPVAKVREKLLEQPELFRALQLSVPPTPEGVMAVQEGDSTHQAFNDYMWRQWADKAAEQGKTIYRYSKAPWLSEGNGAGYLKTLQTKLDTMPSAAPQAVVLGYDDIAHFGAGRALQESGSSGLKKALGGFSDEDAAQLGAKPRQLDFETVGGIPEGLPDQEQNDILKESQPGAYHLGQGVAMLAPWTLANKAWGWVMGEGAAASSALRGAASGLVRGAAAGAADQTAREGVQAASSYASTGDPGTTLGEAGKRVAGAAAGAALPASLLRGLGGLANQVTEEVKWGPRYGGAPGRVEAQGVDVKLGRGHVMPDVVKEAEKRGRVEGGKRPLQVLAKDLDEPLADAANYRLSDVERVGEANAAEHYASDEGGHTLPVRNLVETAAQKLRGLTSEVPKNRLKGVAKPRAESPVRDILNTNIEGISARPTKNGVQLSIKEARAYLDGSWLWKLVPKTAKPKDAAEARLMLKTQLDKLEKSGKSVYVTPRRYDSRHADEVIEQLGKSTDESVADIYEAALKDREGRSWSGKKGGWSQVQEEQALAEDKARDTVRRLGSDKPGGVRRAVVRMGKSKGQAEDIAALEETARRAGGGAVSEKLRGARVAEDLSNLQSWSSIGSQSPRGGQRSLMGLTALGDMAMLRGIYPIARQVDRLPSGAAAAARMSTAATREMMDDQGDERRKKRDEKSAEGYRERASEAGADKPEPRKPRRVVRRRREVARSEANQ